MGSHRSAAFSRFAASLILCACAVGSDPSDPGTPAAGAGGAGASSASGTGGDLGFGGAGGAAGCGCSRELRSVVSCGGEPIETCADTQVCDPAKGACVSACVAAAETKQSVGCDYYATFMDNMLAEVCFAVFVANTSAAPAQLAVDRGGVPLPVGEFTRIPSGAGPALQYAPFDEATGIPPGEVAILFLSGPSGPAEIPKVACPVPSAVPEGVILTGTGIGQSFHIVSSVPVVAYPVSYTHLTLPTILRV